MPSRPFRLRRFLALLPLVLLAAGPAHAQWTADGVAVCTASGTQSLVRIVPDGSGGVILAWLDQRSASDIYAQRLDAAGNPLWAADGVAVGTGSCNNPGLVSDGAGGAIVTWDDNRAAPRSIYAQRLDAATGAPQWTANGVLLSGGLGLCFTPHIVSDAANGAIVAWFDGRGGGNRYQIYAQRVDGSGNPLWTDGGVGLCRLPAAANGITFQSITSDGASGAIVVWADLRDPSYWTTFARRVNAGGDTLWTALGAPVPPASKTTNYCMGLGDGAGGVIVASEIALNQASDPIHVYVQRLDATGVVAAGWPAQGVDLGESSSPGFSNSSIRMVTDGAGGALVAFQRTGSTGNPGQIEVQRVTSAGVADWEATVTTSEEGVVPPNLASDQSGGAIVAWQHRTGVTVPFIWKVFAIRFTPTGVAPGWSAAGDTLCHQATSYQNAAVASDGTSGGIVGWIDQRNAQINVYAGKITADGTVGALFSLVTASASPERARLQWVVGGTSAAYATLYRRAPGDGWLRMASVAIDGTHRVEYEDRDVRPGTTYAYRLGVPGDAGEEFSEEVRVTIPATPARLALEGLQPNPSPGELLVRFSLPLAEPASLALFDLSGRQLLAREVGGLGAGTHRIWIEGGETLSPGVYFLRLEQAGRSVSARAVIGR